MSLLDIAAKLFLSKLGSQGSNFDLGSVISGLGSLLPTQNGELDIADLVGKFAQNGGLASLATSWLSDGDNMNISPSDITSFFGAEKVDEFSKGLGLSNEQASGGLAQMIPELIDNSSKGGSIVDDVVGQLGSSLLKSFF